jgi:hypothetical protein
MKKYYYSDASSRYNHGCSDWAKWQDNGDGTATCIEVNSCSSCWQVGHDQDHTYAVIGDIRKIEDIPDREE